MWMATLKNKHNSKNYNLNPKTFLLDHQPDNMIGKIYIWSSVYIKIVDCCILEDLYNEVFVNVCWLYPIFIKKKKKCCSIRAITKNSWRVKTQKKKIIIGLKASTFGRSSLPFSFSHIWRLHLNDKFRRRTKYILKLKINKILGEAFECEGLLRINTQGFYLTLGDIWFLRLFGCW